MAQPQNTDNMIVMRLVNLTRTGKIKWYLEKENVTEFFITRNFEADIKLTKVKTLTFKFFHNLNEPIYSWLGIYIYHNHKFHCTVRVIDGRKFKYFKGLYSVIKNSRGEE